MDAYTNIRGYWKANAAETADDLETLLANFRILFAYHSGRIENEQVTYFDTREIFENGQTTGFSWDPRALFEQQNQKLCHAYLVPKIAKRSPLTLSGAGKPIPLGMG